MKDVKFVILSNEPLTENVYRMCLRGDVEGIRAGQFVNIQLPGLFLRRPISVCEVKDEVLTIIYKVVGKGTDQMAQMAVGTELDVLTGLGNGYDLSLAGEKPLLVGGGVGVPPMYQLAKSLQSTSNSHIGERKVKVVLGFNTKSEVFYEEEFKKLGCEVIVTTVDGSYGVKGFVTNALPEEYSYFYACGPLPMLKALCAATTTDGDVSLEERMGCGFGICVGCTTKTKNGQKRVCKEGPVFKKSELEF